MSTPTFPVAAPVRRDAAIERFEAIDAHFVAWAREWEASFVQFPALIDGALLRRGEYPQAFPHLLLCACACRDAAREEAHLLDPENLAPTGWLLSPAVCYHAYPTWENETLDAPRVLTARGRCFRREESFEPGRRQIEFEMREIVLAGPADWIADQTAAAKERIEHVAAGLRVSGQWQVAIDPFFLPTAKGKAMMQQLHQTKQEFVAPQPAPLALASINRHETFFAERFNIRLPGGEWAHTACIAFGLDRWADVSSPS